MINVIIILYRGSSISTYLYRKIWNYKKANTEAIQRAISVFDWDMAFQNKDINEKIKIMNETLLNIFNNFITNKISKFDYKKPVWMNREITLLLKKRSKLVKKYYTDPADHNRNLLVNTANECIKLVIAAKEKNLILQSVKLEYPSAAPKACWSILNRFFSNKKIPILVDDKVVSNFAKKAELFNSYSTSNCIPVINKSQLFYNKQFKTSKRLEKTTFTDDDINLIIKNLNVDKADG